MRIPTYDGKVVDVTLPARYDSAKLLALPALIDPHVHFRVPGGEHKEDWQTGARAALAGGVTTVLDMPNNTPAITTYAALMAKKKLIAEQLATAQIPLHYGLYFGATAENMAEIEKATGEIVGIKIFMGSSTGNLLVADKAAQEKLFQRAAELDILVAAHAEDEALINENKARYPNPTLADHSRIRDSNVAARAVERALGLAEKYSTRLHLLHISTAAEVALIRKAKYAGVRVSAEVTPHHLFLTTDVYRTLGTKAQMNPPLRSSEDIAVLWEAINDDTIDCIGTDHAPHTLEEKNQLYPSAPSGVPGIETALPLLLNAYSQSKISLEKIVAITSENAKRIFRLPETEDWVIVDLALTKTVVNETLKTKCGWSSFAGWKLTGWPIATILNGKTYLV